MNYTKEACRELFEMGYCKEDIRLIVRRVTDKSVLSKELYDIIVTEGRKGKRVFEPTDCIPDEKDYANRIEEQDLKISDF